MEVEWSGSRLGCFTPGEEPLVSIGYEAGWASEPVWTRWRREKYLPPPEIEPRSSSS
jgi:hypothetical protein